MSQKGQGTDWLLAGIGEEEEGKKWNNKNQISLESLFRNLLKKKLPVLICKSTICMNLLSFSVQVKC